jgi:hypothetical protein
MGLLDYSIVMDGILGLDFLHRAGTIINFAALHIYSSE